MVYYILTLDGAPLDWLTDQRAGHTAYDTADEAARIAQRLHDKLGIVCDVKAVGPVYDFRKIIKIGPSNKTKINAAIKAVEGRASARCIDYDALMFDISYISGTLKKRGMSKTAAEGLTVTIDHHAQSFPNAYKFVPMSTQVQVTYHRGEWYLIKVQRAECHGPRSAAVVDHMPLKLRRELYDSVKLFN